MQVNAPEMVDAVNANFGESAAFMYTGKPLGNLPAGFRYKKQGPNRYLHNDAFGTTYYIVPGRPVEDNIVQDTRNPENIISYKFLNGALTPIPMDVFGRPSGTAPPFNAPSPSAFGSAETSNSSASSAAPPTRGSASAGIDENQETSVLLNMFQESALRLLRLSEFSTGSNETVRSGMLNILSTSASMLRIATNGNITPVNIAELGVSAAGSAARASVSAATSAAQAAAPVALAGAQSGFGALASGAQSGFGALKSGAQSGFGALASGAQSGFGALASGAQSGFGALKSGAQSGFGALASGAQSGFGAAASGAQEVARAAARAAGALVDTVGSIPAGLRAALDNEYLRAFGAATSATVRSVLTAVYNVIVGIPKAVIDGAGGMSTVIGSIFTALIQIINRTREAGWATIEWARVWGGLFYGWVERKYTAGSQPTFLEYYNRHGGLPRGVSFTSFREGNLGITFPDFNCIMDLLVQQALVLANSTINTQKRVTLESELESRTASGAVYARADIFTKQQYAISSNAYTITTASLAAQILLLKDILCLESIPREEKFAEANAERLTYATRPPSVVNPSDWGRIIWNSLFGLCTRSPVDRLKAGEVSGLTTNLQERVRALSPEEMIRLYYFIWESFVNSGENVARAESRELPRYYNVTAVSAMLKSINELVPMGSAMGGPPGPPITTPEQQRAELIRQLKVVYRTISGKDIDEYCARKAAASAAVAAAATAGGASREEAAAEASCILPPSSRFAPSAPASSSLAVVQAEVLAREKVNLRKPPSSKRAPGNLRIIEEERAAATLAGLAAHGNASASSSSTAGSSNFSSWISSRLGSSSSSSRPRPGGGGGGGPSSLSRRRPGGGGGGGGGGPPSSTFTSGDKRGREDEAEADDEEEDPTGMKGGARRTRYRKNRRSQKKVRKVKKQVRKTRHHKKRVTRRR